MGAHNADTISSGIGSACGLSGRECQGGGVKIKIKQIKSEETLVRCGNRFFTQEQIEDIIKS